jgi:hypothetical protein
LLLLVAVAVAFSMEVAVERAVIGQVLLDNYQAEIAQQKHNFQLSVALVTQ